MKIKRMTMDVALPGVGTGSERCIPTNELPKIECELDLKHQIVKVTGGDLGTQYVPLSSVKFYQLEETRGPGRPPKEQ